MTVDSSERRSAAPAGVRARLQGPAGLALARYGTFGLATVVIGYLVLVPLVLLIARGLVSGAGLTFSNVVDAYSVPGSGEMLWNSFLFSSGTAFLATFTGSALAFICVRTNAPLKWMLYAASLVPLIIPGILYTISWIFLLGDRVGLLNVLFRRLGLDFLTMNIYSLGGMILVEGLHLSPIVFLLMFAAFKANDPSLEESALMSGAGIPSVLRRVTIPLVKPALLVSLLIMFVRALESFETPAILGLPAGRWVFTSRIYRSLRTYPIQYDRAAIYSISLIVLTVIGLFAINRATKIRERFQTITGKGFRPRPIDLGFWRWPVSLFVLLFFLVAVVAPLLALIYLSLLPFFIEPSVEVLSRFSLDSYREVLAVPGVTRSLRNSLILSVSSATFLMAFMSIVAWLTVRSKVRGRRVLDSLATFPIAYPGLVLGVSLIFVYLRVPLPIYGTLWILFIVYITKYMPYGIRYATNSITQIGNELEESALMSGASFPSVFRRVMLPLMAPGLLAGWVYILVVSVRELSASILLYRPGTEVFSIVIWQLWEDGEPSLLAAVGVLLVAGLTVLVAVAYRLGANIGIRE
jgi:iron(III) transport system permease protein